MKNILIFYGSYGGGHLSAAKAIYNELTQQHKDCKVEMFDCIEYINRYINKLSTQAYSEIAKKAPWAWGKVYSHSNNGPLSTISKTSNKLMSKKLYTLLKSFNPDIIISTHPFSSTMCGYLKSKGRLNCKVATITTDYAIHNQWLNYSNYIDYFFVAHEGMKNDLINKGIDPNTVFVCGIPISPRFSENFNRADIRKQFNITPEKPTILFFGGGEYGLGKSKTCEVLAVLANNFNNIQIIAIAGKNEKMKKSFEEIALKSDTNNYIKVLPFTDKIPELMSISTIVVSKPGGLTTTECLASGLPIFIINPLPGQEEENANFLEKNQIGYWLKKDADIKSALEDFLSENNIKSLHTNALKLAKKDSTKNICNTLLNS